MTGLAAAMEPVVTIMATAVCEFGIATTIALALAGAASASRLVLKLTAVMGAVPESISVLWAGYVALSIILWEVELESGSAVFFMAEHRHCPCSADS